MQVWKRTNRVGLWLLVLSAALVFASTTVATSFAQVSDTSSKSAGTVEEELGPNAGDPDMPTGDTPPSGSGSAGSFDNGTGMTLHTSNVVAEPSKRFGAWAHWKLALRLYVRGFWLR